MPPRSPSMKTVFAFDRLRQRIDTDVVNPFLTLAGTEYAKGVQIRMRNSPASGRVYPRGKRSHRASAPGQAPKPDSGRLVQSVRFQRRDHGSIKGVEVGSTVAYSLYLEFGAAKLAAPPKRIRRSRKQTGREARWILYPRPAWGPELQILKARMPELMRRASRMRRRR